jgi:MFS family permease
MPRPYGCAVRGVQPARSANRAALLFPALRHPRFRLFWFGLVLSGLGSQFTQIAMSWQMYEMTGSPLQLGLLGLSRAVPSMVLLLLGGLLADAVDRRRLMMVTQSGQLCVTSTVLLLSLGGSLSPGVFYAASACLALFSALEGPARQALIPNLVPPTDLTNALALNSSQRSVAMIAGPSIAGIVLSTAGPSANYAIDSSSWLCMLAALAQVGPVTQRPGGRRAISLRALGEGIDYVWTHPILLSMMLLDFGQTFLGAPNAMMVIYARDILNVGPQGFGLLSTASSVGSIGTAAVMSVFGNVRRAGIGVLIGVSLYGVCTVLLGLSHVFWFSLLMRVGEGMGNTISTVLRGTILQLNIPDELRGRVTGVNSVFTNGGPQLGTFRSGAVGQLIGPELSVLGGGLSTLAVVALITVWVPMVRHFEIMEADRGNDVPSPTREARR